MWSWSDEQRTRVAAVLFGKQKIGRDSHTLNEYELQLIRDYRAADSAGKQMLRTMALFAANNPDDHDDDREGA